ncbi:metallophosphoesterase family protein [Streptomyces buecherae]|uniref:Metallophosphoesterase n=1 Tax=Streptomyces buecherae TaxID=2763006 RepID=A0A7H8N349_9ACTN|nr:metallophosphoesterase family protein [Streptomyces buecherae]QKW48850.1 metallophosphoesterase [Streptomyces buecherae]
MSVREIVIVSDVQFPLHDARAVRNLWRYIADRQPAEVLIIGDFMNYAAPSRWSKNTRAEFENCVLQESEGGKALLHDLREGYGGPVKFMRGNHDIRPAEYLRRYAPALAASRAFDVDVLLDFEGLDIEMLPPFAEVAPGWVAMHGHELRGLSPIPGRTAASKVRKLDRSVVMGHTHKNAVSPETVGVGRHRRTLYGFETGHLMDEVKAEYLSQGVANWQKGWGRLLVGKYSAAPVPVYVERDGSFVVDGVRHGAIQRNEQGRFVRQKEVAVA